MKPPPYHDDLYLLTQPNPPIPTTLLLPHQPLIEPLDATPTNPKHPEHFPLSLHAMTGQTTPCTLRFQASIMGHTVSVLVDTGNSHNILQPRVATFLNLPITTIDPFTVMVGNGAYIQCSGLCPEVSLIVQQTTFKVSFYLLPIHGADAVLGV